MAPGLDPAQLEIQSGCWGGQSELQKPFGSGSEAGRGSSDPPGLGGEILDLSPPFFCFLAPSKPRVRGTYIPREVTFLSTWKNGGPRRVRKRPAACQPKVPGTPWRGRSSGERPHQVYELPPYLQAARGRADSQELNCGADHCQDPPWPVGDTCRGQIQTVRQEL